MSSLDNDLSPLIGFFSYSRSDDEGFDGLSTLRAAIQWELSEQLGRSPDNLRIWQDKFAIPDTSRWEETVKLAISESVFFVPIITPRMIRSQNCVFEFASMLERERELGRDDLVFPILYILVPELEDADAWRDHAILKIVKEHQYFDWRSLRFHEPSSTQVRAAVEQFCRGIAKALRKPSRAPKKPQQWERTAVPRIAEQELQPKVLEIEAARHNVAKPAATSTKVFISYRREDTKYQAKMIYTALVKSLPQGHVFMDIDSIPLGADFVEILEGWVDQCDILLAVIGPNWMSAKDLKAGGRRLYNSDDFVRVEVREGLRRGIPVVPVLLDGARMPDADELPEDLRKLVRRQAEFVEFRTFDTDVERLIRKLLIGR